MSPTIDAPDLPSLDQIELATAPHDILARNLNALETADATMAAALRTREPPSGFRLAGTLDGDVNYRCEEAGAPAAWLGGTGMPRARAEALCATFDSGGQNVALPAIGTGAELAYLLQRLGRHQAVFVFEDDLDAWAAVLRVRDLEASLLAGRCVVISGEDSRERLQARLDSRPGLLPPGKILNLPGVAATRMRVVQAACERVMADVSVGRNRRLQRVRDTVVSRRSALCEETRLAVLALHGRGWALPAARGLARAGRGLGWHVVECVATGPDSVHPLPHCEALHAFRPNLTICVGHGPESLPITIGGDVCAWAIDERSARELSGNSVDEVRLLAATPTMMREMRQWSGEARDVEAFYWPSDLLDTSVCPGGVPGKQVYIVADHHPLDPERCGIDQPTHKRLWTDLLERVARCWDRPEIASPEALLRQSERSAGVSLGSGRTRELFLRLIPHALIPSVVPEMIARVCDGLSIPWAVIGRGWPAALVAGGRHLADTLSGETTWESVRCPLAVIFAGRADPLCPDLLVAAGHGWPLVLHNPGRSSCAAQLGGMLLPDEHYATFADASDLAGVLRSPIRQWQRRAERARMRLRDGHTFQDRLQMLHQLLCQQ